MLPPEGILSEWRLPRPRACRRVNVTCQLLLLQSKYEGIDSRVFSGIHLSICYTVQIMENNSVLKDLSKCMNNASREIGYLDAAEV